MSLISGLLAAILALLGLGPTSPPSVPPTLPGMVNIVGTTALTVHPDLARVLDSFDGSMSGTAGSLTFDVNGQLNLTFTEGVIKLNGGIVFAAPDLEPLTYQQMELSLGDLTVYGTVDGRRVAMWSIELLPMPLGQRQAVNTPDMLLRWIGEGLKIFNAWTPDIARDDNNNNDGSSQAQSDHEVYG